MKRNRIVLLIVAALLIAAGVLSSRCADEAKAPADKEARAEAQQRAERVVFPRDARARRRPPPAAAPAGRSERRREPSADPIQRAMAFPDGGAVFIEVNAIRHSELVERLLACRQGDAADAMRRFQDELGIDPLEDVDRMALHNDVFAASGFFEELKLPGEVAAPEAYGDETRIYRLPNVDDPSQPAAVVARVGDGLLLLGEDEAQVKAAVDRAEGRGGDDVKALPPDVTGTEIYGRFGPELLAELLGGPEGAPPNPLVQRVTEIVTDGTVRVLVDDAVSMSLDLETRDEQAGEDLAKAVGGALAGARQRAEIAGDEELAALLDKARVLKQENGRFGIDIAVPGETVLEAMGCPSSSAPVGANDDGEAATDP